MHLYMLTRGIKPLVDNYINDLLAQYFPYAPDTTGKMQMLQLSIRPIQLWEVVFPMECLKGVMETVLPYESIDTWQPTPGWRGMKMDMLRMALGAQKLPPLKLDSKALRPIRKANLAVYPFAIKEDKPWVGEKIATDPNTGAKVNLEGKEQI